MTDKEISTSQSLLSAISEAFANVKRGEGPTLHEAAMEGYGSEEDRLAQRALDSESIWEEVPDKAIEANWSALCYLDPPGFRYYTPAYMSFAIRNLDSQSLSTDWIVYELDLALDDASEVRLTRYKLFNEMQSKVICRFLRFCADHTDAFDDVAANSALEHYWGQFCA